MLATRLFGKQDLRLLEVEEPTIGEGEILLKVGAAAICGTDVRMVKNGSPGVSADHPLTLGHEIAGVIERIGKEVKGLEAGLRVVVAPNMGCGTCDLCVSGNTQLCPDYRALGVHLDGGFCRYVRIPEEAVKQGNVVPIRGKTPLEEAALTEPLSCVLNGSARCGIRPGDTVLIVGAGPIGIMHAKLAKISGASSIAISDINQGRLEIGSRLDPDFVTLGSATLKDEVEALTHGRGVDVCITACPAPAAQQEALELTGINGRINFFGGLPSDRARVELDTNLIHYRQLTVTGTTRSSLSQFRQTLRLIEQGIIAVGDLITARYSIESSLEVIAGAERGDGLKKVILFD